jgi:hypothetical protein
MIDSPNPQGGAHFGFAMTSLANNYPNYDTHYLAVSAPGEPVDGMTGRGRVYLFKASEISKEDSDKDGLYDSWEVILGTNPNNSDTDGDGFSDWEELYVYKSDPLQPPICGNNILEPGEQCDGDKFPLAQDTCQELGFPYGGILTCKNDCTFNTDACLECVTAWDCSPKYNGIYPCINGRCVLCDEAQGIYCPQPYVCMGGECVLY